MTQPIRNVLTLNYCVNASFEQWNKTTYLWTQFFLAEMDVSAQSSCEVVSIGKRNEGWGIL